MAKAAHPLKIFRHSFTPKKSLESLAKSVGRSKATLCRIEKGRQSVPDDLLEKLCNATGIPARELRPDLAKLLEREAAE